MTSLAKTSAALSLALAALSLPAVADRPVIDIKNARVEAYPIALAPPAGDPTSGAAVMEALRGDLTRSGLFKILDPKSFLANPATEGMTEKTIDFSKWTTVGAQGLLKASATVAGDVVTVEFFFFDAAKGSQILHGSYHAPIAGQRQIAHGIADEIVKFFTGDRGDFQTRIAYVRETADGKQIVVADSDGANAQSLTGASINLLPAWVPGGNALAFTTFRDGAPHIYTVDTATRAIKPLVLMGDFATGAAYSPDGLRFTFSASINDNTDIYLSQADASAGRKLTDARGIDISATWSPDGKQLCFISDRAGGPQLYLMNADGTNQRRLTFQGNYNQEPAWSPKGDLIAFSGRDEKRSFDIYTVNPTSGVIIRVTQDSGTNEKPSWSPNGRHLVFSSTRSGKRQLWMSTPDGKTQSKLTEEGKGASDPAWGPFIDGK
jgi:TolB protein